MGGTDFKWAAGHHWPPAGDDPGLSFSVSSAIRFLFLDLTSFIAENVLSHTHVCCKQVLPQQISIQRYQTTGQIFQVEE